MKVANLLYFLIIFDIKYTLIDDRVGPRLFNLMLYLKYGYDVLILTPVFLQSLNIDLDQLILFDFPDGNNDMIRALGKLPKGEEEKPTFHLLCSGLDEKGNKDLLENLRKEIEK